VGNPPGWGLLTDSGTTDAAYHWTTYNIIISSLDSHLDHGFNYNTLNNVSIVNEIAKNTDMTEVFNTPGLFTILICLVEEYSNGWGWHTNTFDIFIGDLDASIQKTAYPSWCDCSETQDLNGKRIAAIITDMQNSHAYSPCGVGGYTG